MPRHIPDANTLSRSLQSRFLGHQHLNRVATGTGNAGSRVLNDNKGKQVERMLFRVTKIRLAFLLISTKTQYSKFVNTGERFEILYSDNKLCCTISSALLEFAYTTMFYNKKQWRPPSKKICCIGLIEEA
jgi:hypothetical protein